MMHNLLWGLVFVGAAGLVAAVFTVYQAAQAKSALSEANSEFAQLTAAVSAGDSAAAEAHLYAAQEATLRAQHNTAGPVWWAASEAPLIGDDVTAVRTITDVVDHVAQGVLPSLVEASSTLSADDLQPADGAIELGDVERLAPLLRSAKKSLMRDLAKVQALDADSLISPVAGPVRQLESKLTEASTVAMTASKVALLIPPMLGAGEPRTYLVLFQNNAEIRASGGIPGAIATITADNGKITLEQQGSAHALGQHSRSVLPLSAEEEALFTSNLGIFPADVTFTPDFPRTAMLAKAMWRRATGEHVDGVLSTDPVALSYLLAGTGPVELADGRELTADDAVQLLLNQVYLEQPDTDLQNAFFADAAREVFEGVVSGQGSAPAILSGMRKAASEHRIMIWSARKPEENVLRSTVLAGAMPTLSTESPQLGVYLNDGTGAKMDYYLDYDVAVDSESCDSSGTQTFDVTVTMASSAPERAAQLPPSVIGPGRTGAAPGSMRTNVLVYAPFGGVISEPTIDGRPLISAGLTHSGRAVAAQTIDLAPGQSTELGFQVTSGPGQPLTAEVEVTPGLPDSGTTSVTPSDCE